jgi:N-dimethylarginine dimethylaminohydrolase
MKYGVASMTSPLRRVALRRPDAMVTADPLQWHYGASFDGSRVQSEHAAFSALVEASGTEILWMDGPDQGNADAVFTFDASLMTPAGAILMAPGKSLRRGEQELHRAFYEAEQIPVIGEITGEGLCEAGDSFWVDETTLAVGRGFRTNQAGIDQLGGLLANQGIAVEAFDLPLFKGASACLHLLSLISPVAERCALIHPPLFPVALLQLLEARDYTLLQAPEQDFIASDGLNLNVLATAPGKCIMIDGFAATRELLESNGIEVSVFTGDALCRGGEGGPTCLTRPLLRD